MSARLRLHVLILGAPIALTLVSGCDREPPRESAKADPPMSDTMLPPPIIPPEIAGPAEPPSYEVAIATAAADRNRAKKKCAELPEIERATCEAQAEANFDAAAAELESLRGDQQ